MSHSPHDRASEIARLRQTALRAEVDAIGSGQWITAYRHSERATGETAYFCGLVRQRAVKAVLAASGWELSIGDGLPGFSTEYGGRRPKTRYHRFGGDSVVEPLVIVREFHGIRPDYVELSEEFRHGMNLFEDRGTGQFWRLDRAGEARLVAEVTRDLVRIETRAMRQYLASRNMVLVVYFDCVVWSDLVLDAEETHAMSEQEGTKTLVYSLAVSARSAPTLGRSCSVLTGKRLVLPLKVSDRWIPAFEERPRQYLAFLTGVDADGEEVSSSCDPDSLADGFGKNPKAPAYLTTVVFRREVLKRYQDHPEKYLVEDGLLRRAGLWSLRIDNDGRDRVSAFLGDLGKYLPYEDQAHWRSHNIVPLHDGHDLSRTNIERSFNANFWDAENPDLLFKSTLAEFQERWKRKHGWDLWRPVRTSDAHILTKLRVPVVESIVEFEDQVLGLAKVLSDSLNMADMAREVGPGPEKEGSIARLKRYLGHHGYAPDDGDLALLDTVQRLRSTGVAHLKGRDFDRVARQVGLHERKYSEVFSELLRRATALLRALTAHFEL